MYYLYFMDLKGSKLLAVFYGLLCHSVFLVAGAIMFFTILTGFQFSVGPLEGLFAVAINFLLLIQFPVGHSFFLSNRGMKVLEIFAPKSYAKTLRTTVYATIASVQRKRSMASKTSRAAPQDVYLSLSIHEKIYGGGPKIQEYY